MQFKIMQFKIIKTMNRFSSIYICSVWIATGAIALGLISSLSLSIQPVASQPVDAQITTPSANILKSLNLSDTQRQQIKSILEKDRETRRSDQQELRTKEQELRTMMDSNDSKEALIQKFNQVQNLRRQNAQNRFEQMLSVREVLTPQQRSQLSKAANEANSNFSQPRQRRFARPNN
jgi:Spy/CpxP family protein refolding chaperone